MKNYTIHLSIAAILCISSTFLSSCEKHNEGEMITDIFLNLTDSAGNTKQYHWQDPDGSGPQSPVISDTINLHSGTYQAQLAFTNNGNDITADIENESADHLVCFDYSNLTMPPFVPFVFTATDKDKNGLGIGIKSNWITKGAGWGNITITLKHQPGIKTGDCSLGETDAQVQFPYVLTH